MRLSLYAILGLITSQAAAAKTKTHCNRKGYTLCPKANGPKPYCADTQYDNDNCGSCGNICDVDHYCRNGVCKEVTFACDPNTYRDCHGNVPCGQGGGCSCVRAANSDGPTGETRCLLAGSGCFGDGCHTNADCKDGAGGICDFSPCCTSILKGQGACFYPSSLCSQGSGNTLDPRNIFGIDSSS